MNLGHGPQNLLDPHCSWCGRSGFAAGVHYEPTNETSLDHCGLRCLIEERQSLATAQGLSLAELDAARVEETGGGGQFGLYDKAVRLANEEAERIRNAATKTTPEPAPAQTIWPLPLLWKLKWLIILFATIAWFGYRWINGEESPMEALRRFQVQKKRSQVQKKRSVAELPRAKDKAKGRAKDSNRDEVSLGQIEASPPNERTEAHKDSGAALETLRQESTNKETAEKKPHATLEDELVVAKSELTAYLDYMEKVKADYNIQIGIINRLTANKTRPVRQGSQAYKQCLSASKRIKAIEDTSGQIKAKKAELENKIKVLTEAVDAAR